MSVEDKLDSALEKLNRMEPLVEDSHERLKGLDNRLRSVEIGHAELRVEVKSIKPKLEKKKPDVFHNVWISFLGAMFTEPSFWHFVGGLVTILVCVGIGLARTSENVILHWLSK